MFEGKRIILLVILLTLICIVYPLAAQQGQQGLTPEQELGMRLYFDENLSLNRNQSCASCHDPDTGFVDPENVTAPFPPVSDGSDPALFGTRNAPSAAYAAFSPFFYWDGIEGLYVGGQFWDGRANTLAEQAAGPFLNPVEMAMPNEWSVVSRLREDDAYITGFSEVYKLDLEMIPVYNPDDKTPPGVLEIYDRMAKAIGEFEKTITFNKFSSKFDYYLAGVVDLSPAEEKGLKLFNNKGKCALCHLSKPTIAPGGGQIPPLFTDFTYDNLGVPPNVNIPGYDPEKPDLGLGGRLDIAAKDPAGLQKGKFKVMTLRNIAITPPFSHNGVFKTLEQIVHFYNTRDVLGEVPDNNDPGFGITGWPAPEVPLNVNTGELGDLKLTPDQEQAIVAFLLTLTDGYGEANGLPPLEVTFPPFP